MANAISLQEDVNAKDDFDVEVPRDAASNWQTPEKKAAGKSKELKLEEQMGTLMGSLRR